MPWRSTSDRNHCQQMGWALSGLWTVKGDRIVSASAGATLAIQFNARKVFFVMGSENNQSIEVTLTFDGKKTAIKVKDHQLYDAIALHQSGSGLLTVQAGQPGLEIYTATFGE